MCRSALRSSTARNSASLRSVMSTATPSICWRVALFGASARRDPAHAAIGYRHAVLDVELVARRHGLSARRARDARDPPRCVVSRTFSKAIGGPCGLPARRRGAVRRRTLSRGHVPHRTSKASPRSPRDSSASGSPPARVAIRLPRSPLDEQGGDQSRLEQQDRRIRGRSRANTVSHAVGSRNLTMVSAGSRRSSMPQRRTARQSTTGTFLIEHRSDRRRRGAVQQRARRWTPACFACSS